YLERTNLTPEVDMHRSLIRRAVVIVVTMAVILGSGIGHASATPLNGANRFSNAPLLPAGDGRYTGNNIFATKQAGEPDHAGDDGGASVWYRLRVNHNRIVRISTRGSDFDTLLAVYRGPDVRHLVVVRQNDDVDLANNDLTSLVQFPAQAGVTYRIAVDGFGGDRGHIVLRVIRP
ncbi:MAG: hypothetical protein ABW008_07235, partial [Acidimicrobiales bacterium]